MHEELECRILSMVYDGSIDSYCKGEGARLLRHICGQHKGCSEVLTRICGGK